MGGGHRAFFSVTRVPIVNPPAIHGLPAVAHKDKGLRHHASVHTAGNRQVTIHDHRVADVVVAGVCARLFDRHVAIGMHKEHGDIVAGVLSGQALQLGVIAVGNRAVDTDKDHDKRGRVLISEWFMHVAFDIRQLPAVVGGGLGSAGIDERVPTGRQPHSNQCAGEHH